MKTAIALFLSTRVLLYFIISIVILYIPYLGFFPYSNVSLGYHLPDVLTKLANFDGVQYLIISREEYYTYNQAYFPFYPISIYYTSALFRGNILLSAIIISNLAFVGVIWTSLKLFPQFIGKKETYWFLFFLLTFPTAFFFSAVYTESLFLFLFLLSLYFFTSKKYFFAFLCGMFAALTRLTGLFLVIPYITVISIDYFSRKHRVFSKENIMQLFAILGPIIGFGIYSTYLYITRGDALFFFSAQNAFGAHRSTHLILLPQVFYRYIKIFLTSANNFQLFISYIEFSFFLFAFSITLYVLYKLLQKKQYIKEPFIFGLGLFSLINIFLPTTTGTLSSIPRYALLSLIVFILLARIKNTYIKIGIGIFFGILQIILCSFFIQGYFIS